eukprot:1327744-Pyramimonas_sp.AAC.1
MPRGRRYITTFPFLLASRQTPPPKLTSSDYPHQAISDSDESLQEQEDPTASPHLASFTSPARPPLAVDDPP